MKTPTTGSKLKGYKYPGVKVPKLGGIGKVQGLKISKAKNKAKAAKKDAKAGKMKCKKHAKMHCKTCQ